MKAAFASIALFAAGALAQNSFTINTPSNVVECEPTQITWSGGVAPYYLSVLPGSSPNGTPLESFNTTSATSLTWTVNIQSGTSIGFTLRDSTGAVAQTASVTVTAGTSSSCLNSTSVISGSTAAAGSSASTPGATTTPAATAGTTAAGSASASGSASTSTSTSGASANAAQFGAAGVVGAAIAALFL